MTAIIIPGVVRPALQTRAHFRNGLYPDAGPVTRIQEEGNRVVALCTKQWAFTSPCPDVPAAGGASARQRWRAFIRTGSHHGFIVARFMCLPSNNTESALSYVTFSTAGGGIVAVCEFYYGGETASDTANSISVGMARTIELSNEDPVDLDADTEYEVDVYDVGNGRTMSLCLLEMPKELTTENGYVASGVVAGESILDVHRSSPTTVLRNAWLHNGAPLITWSSDLDADSPTRTSATKANLIDGVTGAPTAATAGFTLNLANRTTIRRTTGIPCVMKVWGKCVAGFSGHVYLIDSSNTELADCEVSDATEDWFTVEFDLPATNGKYDLQFAGDGTNLLTVRAVSIYQYEA